MRVTIPLTNGQRFTAECGEDRWVEIPPNAKPDGRAWSECEAQYRHASEDDYRGAITVPCGEWNWSASSARFRIRPSCGRSWSDIGLAERPAQALGWTVVHAPVPLDQVEEVQGDYGDGWTASYVTGGCDWSTKMLAEGRYRVRYKPGCPKPEGAAQPFPPIGTAQVKAPVQDAFADPRIAALEAENAALRWAVFHGVSHLATDNAGVLRAKCHGSDHWQLVKHDDIPKALLARAAMERKP